MRRGPRLTVPSVLALVNERFDHVFKKPEDPQPRPLEATRPEVAKQGARTVALPLPKDRLPEPGEPRVDTILPVLASTIADFIAHITRESPGASATAPATPCAPHGRATLAFSSAR